ncbi:MAG: DJ-1/PfpI family protein, partial [Phycisphaerae bacterium]
MKRILIATGDCAESLEVFYPLHRCREQGWEVQVAAPTRKRLQLVVHDFEPGCETYSEKPGYGLSADLTFNEVEAGRYDGLVIPGGRAPEYIRNSAGMVGVVRAFAEAYPDEQLSHSLL